MSKQIGDEVHIETEDASGGKKNQGVRYVLGVSLLAAIVLLSAIWIFGAATQGDAEEDMTVAGAGAGAGAGQTTADGADTEAGILPDDETLDPAETNPEQPAE